MAKNVVDFGDLTEPESKGNVVDFGDLGGDESGYLTVTPGGGDSVAEEMDRSNSQWTPEMLSGAIKSKGLDIGKTISNVPGSAVEFGKNLAMPFVDINQTVQDIGRTAVGAVEKLIPGVQEDEKIADAVGKFFINRYGGTDQLRNTIETDPVGFLADVSGVLGLGAAATTKLPAVSKTLGVVSSATDPIRIASLPFNNFVTRKITGNFLQRGMPFSDQRNRVMAGEELNAMRGGLAPEQATAEAKRIQEWNNLQGRNPDLPTPTYGQQSGNMQTAAREQSLSRTGDNMQRFTYNDAMVNDAAVNNLTRQVGPERTLPQVMTDRQEIGRGIVDSIEANRRVAKSQVEDLYADIPNEPVESRGVKQVVDEIAAEKPYLTDAEYPGWAVNKLNNIFKKASGEPARGYSYETGPVEIAPTTAEASFQELHAFRKELGDAIRSAEAGATPNYALSRNLKKIKSAIDGAIDNAGASPELADAYQTAKDAYIGYAERFKTGAVNDVLRRGKQITGLNVADEAIARKFWTPSGADDFIRAVGGKRASEAMRGYAASEVMPLLEKEIPDIKGVMKWMVKNKQVIEKYGLTNDLKELVKSQVPTHLQKALESGKSNILNNPALSIPQVKRLMRDIGPSLRILYRDNPAALQALNDYHKVLRVLSRNKNVSYSSGSSTVEKASNMSLIGNAASLGAIALGKGWVFSSARNVIKGLFNGPIKASEAQINKLLMDATFDPILAQDLMSLAKNPNSKKAIDNLSRWIGRGSRAAMQHSPGNIYKGEDNE